jgi:hypothetical protein
MQSPVPTEARDIGAAFSGAAARSAAKCSIKRSPLPDHVQDVPGALTAMSFGRLYGP